MELPKLQGTEKQIIWAENIRKNRIKVWQTCSAIYDAIETVICKKNIASWWIANKDCSADEIYRIIQGGTSEKKTSPSKVLINTLIMDHAINYEGAERVNTEYGYKTVFPTRNISTGEIVCDKSLPF